FLTDTYVTIDPTAPEIAEATILAAEQIRRFGMTPKAALLSHSNSGSRDSASSLKMREAAALLRDIAPDLGADGEMHGDAARDRAAWLTMCAAAARRRATAPALEAHGEMRGAAALDPARRQRVFPHSTLEGEANLLVFPGLDAANIALTTSKPLTEALHVGP